MNHQNLRRMVLETVSESIVNNKESNFHAELPRKSK